MKLDRFTSLLENKVEIQQLETAELKSILEEYPYFQSARALYLKGLKTTDSFKYNNELKLTAAYTKDRSILFDFITSTAFHTKENIHQQISDKISNTEQTSKEKTVQKHSDKIDKVAVKETLEVGKPIAFSPQESYSFNQWLQLSTSNKVFKAPKKKVNLKEAIIDTFIEKNPKIEPLEKGKNLVVPVTTNQQDDALMTETLAKVYLEQKKYENAIQAYRILSLKYPEKSGFFADQIKRIQILQK
ncbi:hypothetical protein [uncultured Polaribacter sp.]|uniref:hypothetical protein n=1 Tax=uncultured Polaribacter sp. TaxID=174711 RepID=UPI002636710F|nr:hypothetical protein [uncultured Polaribacter sp.]